MAVTTPLTPGVYVEERSLLPPSVVGVATAVPAFIGYVAKALPTTPQVAEINSLRDFEALFGTTPPRPYKVMLVDGAPRLYRTVPGPAPDGGGAPNSTDELVPTSQRPPWLLWYSLDLYFRNGGGAVLCRSRRAGHRRRRVEQRRSAGGPQGAGKAG